MALRTIVCILIVSLARVVSAAVAPEGLGDRWITEAESVPPGLTDADRIVHGIEVESADGWTVEAGDVGVETAEAFYGGACLRLSGPAQTTITRECSFIVTPTTFVTCAFRPETGAKPEFRLRDADGAWHSAIANSGYYWTHGYQHLTGRFTGFYLKPPLQTGARVTEIGFSVSGTADVLVDDLHIVEASGGYALSALLPQPAVRIEIADPIEVPEFSVEHPFLKLDAAAAARRRDAYRKDPTAAAKVIADAEVAIAEWEGRPYHLPAGEGAVGSSYYSCDVHPEVTLEFDPQRPLHRLCPKCGQSVINDRTTNAWIYKHSAWFYQQAVACADAYSYTGDDRYAAEVRRRLRLYCQLLRESPSVMFGGGASNAQWAHITITACCQQSYDLTYDSAVWTEEDRQLLRNCLGAPYGPPQMPGAYTGNYIGYNAYEALRTGLLFNDRELVSEALNYRAGRAIQYLFDDDGMWREKTWGYHNMVLNSLRATAVEAEKRLGIDLAHHSFGGKSLERAYTIWVMGSFPDGSLPLINDNRSGRKGGLNINEWLAVPFAMYGDALYDPNNRPMLDSMDLRGPGWCFLRSDAESPEHQVVAVLDYGSQRGAAHGHSDTMQAIVWANGETIAPDLDVAEYTRYPYYYAPSAHNTVSPLAAEGTVAFFSDGPGLKVVRAHTAEQSLPRQHDRTLLLAADGAFLADVFSVSAPADEQWAWHWHCPGEFSTNLQMRPYDGLDMTSRDYAEVKNQRALATDAPWQATWRTEKQLATLTMLGTPGTAVVAADGYGYLPTEIMTMAIARRTATATTFASVLECRPLSSAAPPSPVMKAVDGGFDGASEGFTYSIRVADGAAGAPLSFPGGTAAGRLVAVAKDFTGAVMQVVALDGSVLQTDLFQTSDADFDALEACVVADAVTVRYAGPGPLTMQWNGTVEAEPDQQQAPSVERDGVATVVTLPAAGEYRLRMR